MKKIYKTKKCKKCNRRYPISKFRTYKRRNWKGTVCQLCRNSYAHNQYEIHKTDKNWVRGNRKRVMDWYYQNIQKHKNSCKLWRDKSERGYWHKKVASIKANCRIRGFTCDLNVKILIDLFNKQNGKCALTGRLLNRDGRRTLNSLSVDRINTKQDYTTDNIRLVCWHANMAKSFGSDEELFALCKDILKIKNKKYCKLIKVY